MSLHGQGDQKAIHAVKKTSINNVDQTFNKVGRYYCATNGNINQYPSIISIHVQRFMVYSLFLPILAGGPNQFYQSFSAYSPNLR